MYKLDRKSTIYIELFRVSTPEILNEMSFRLLTGHKRDFKDFTNEELFDYLYTMRKEDFKLRQPS